MELKTHIVTCLAKRLKMKTRKKLPLLYTHPIGSLPRPRVVLDLLADLLVKHTTRATKFALPSPFLVAMRLWDKKFSAEFYPTLEDLMNDVAEVLAIEARALVDGGVDIIQLDDPALTYYCDTEFIKGLGHDSRIDMSRGMEERIPAAVAAINRITKGLESEVHLHCCHSVFKRGSDVKGSYQPILSYFDKLKVNRINVEFAYKDTGHAADLTRFPSHVGAGLGVVDVRSERVQTVDEIVRLTSDCLKHIDAKRVALNPDCGFAPDSGEPPTLDEAYQKLHNLCEAARRLRG